MLISNLQLGVPQQEQPWMLLGLTQLLLSQALGTVTLLAASSPDLQFGQPSVQAGMPLQKLDQ